MIKEIGLSLGVLLLAQQTYANTDMQIKTNFGTIEIELYDDKAPLSVTNFKNYVKSNFYNGTIFHRVIPGFMIQGGGMNEKMIEKSTQAAIKNESVNGLKNDRGTLAMARTNHPDSATSQFFINVANNDFLNKSAGNSGYAVFGKVTKGMDVVDKIVNVPTENYGMHQNVPKQSIKIINISYKVAPNK
ncbi:MULTISPECIES: peptidylprolyl isomerase [unclassified Acinetobacter]|uniref:peptidylprolyl isomerase n=1 Tax=unclassified Acinetobacter TaxID=196816 RepID=UPI0025767BC8|nr:MULTISPECIES: peptidylprolyl isomerase [unclassified Acinetobacter]MDM1765619.1 peptidyl-prolyl cis-trans isomerase [Acinetobacter sp. 226-1]MDM1769211.1 peptidyl-prolyl cis-trans isomerase [Acinetobacter sp. 226-4]